MALWICPNCMHIYNGIILRGHGYSSIGFITAYEENDNQIPVLYCFNKDLLEMPLNLLLDEYGVWVKHGNFWLEPYLCHKCGKYPDMRFKRNKYVSNMILEAFYNRKHISKLGEGE